MHHRLATYVSAIGSPVLVVPIFGLLIISHASPNRSAALLWDLLFIIVGLLPPLLYTALEVRHGRITDLHVAVREQRAIPFALSVLSSAVLLGAYRLLDAPIEVQAMAASLTVCAILFTLITRYWKISIHSAGYTGSVISAAMLVDLRYLWWLAGVPLIFWARRVRNRHTMEQVVLASVVVAICVVAILSAMTGHAR